MFCKTYFSTCFCYNINCMSPVFCHTGIKCCFPWIYLYMFNRSVSLIHLIHNILMWILMVFMIILVGWIKTNWEKMDLNIACHFTAYSQKTVKRLELNVKRIIVACVSLTEFSSCLKKYWVIVGNWNGCPVGLCWK